MITPSICNDTEKTWLIDLDNTVYDTSSKMMEEIDRKIEEFLTRDSSILSSESNVKFHNE